MAERSKIQWTDHTFNPWRGCTKATWVDAAGKLRLHTGCLNCYAEADRSVKLHGIRWGQGQARVPKAASGWKEPLSWARKAAKAGERHRVFCASLADVLDPEVPDSMRAPLWDAIRQTHRIDWTDPSFGEKVHEGGLDWLLLTKRPENWRLIPEDVRPLVWLGTSISDQETADEWGARLHEAEGFRFRFLSVEPLVSPVSRLPLDGIDWVICGGESGPKARPCNVEWVRSIVRQCREAGVPCFVKQLGEKPFLPDDGRPIPKPFNCYAGDDNQGPVKIFLNDKKGGDWDEWPEDLRVRQFPK